MGWIDGIRNARSRSISLLDGVVHRMDWRVSRQTEVSHRRYTCVIPIQRVCAEEGGG